MHPEIWNTAGYLRLSREDGDKAESDSILNQRKLLTQYLEDHPELRLVDFYQDDGCTGTNFDRPAFRRMEADIQAGRVNCVLVKDLSRFGRDYIEMGRYLERVFPALEVRFIAINDHVDSARGAYDLLLPMKNIFNTQYARDISDKVRSAILAKQRRGEFVGAFACYGYRKDPDHRGRLVVDPPAAQIVRRIFDLFESGTGKVRIAKCLNAEGIPCPSQYKQILGERYSNGRRLESTTYWTYATIHRILQNRMYLGSMEQGRSVRPVLRGRAKKKPPEEWVVVEGTHEAIIGRPQWDRVQALLNARSRTPDLTGAIGPFAGLFRCGDCGRAMVKTRQSGGIFYVCGSYKRYGASICTGHRISHAELEEIVLEDLNQLIAAAGDLETLVQAAGAPQRQDRQEERRRLAEGQARLYRLKKGAYEDYREGLIQKEDYLRYREDYDRQEDALLAQLRLLEDVRQTGPGPWVEALVRIGRLTTLDRTTAAEAVREIQIFADGRLEIHYAFSPPPDLPQQAERPPGNA